MRQIYRGYIIECKGDEIKVLSTLEEDVFPFEDFFSVVEAQEAINPVADYNDKVVGMVLDLFPKRSNVIPFPCH